MDLSGRTAIVTGAAGGIGFAIAQGMAAAGAALILTDLNPAATRQAASRIGPDVEGHALDVSDCAAIEQFFREREEAGRRIDVLVNSAGLFESNPWGKITREIYDRVFDVNVAGLMFMTQAVMAHMRRHALQGAIVNLASAAGRRASPVSAVYSASKAAVISFTQSAALAGAPLGIRVNAMAPGAVQTSMWEQVDREAGRQYGLAPGAMTEATCAKTPLGRLSKPEDCVGLATFLASPLSSYITGQTFNVDGGMNLN